MATVSSEYLRGYLSQKQDDGSLKKLLPEISGNAIHYIEGNTTGTAGTWTGTSEEITSYYNGLTIAYKMGIAGASTTTLNINNLGALIVYRNATSKITTHYPVNSVLILIYTTNNSGVGSWQLVDYDSTNTFQFRSYSGALVTLDALYRYMLVVTDFEGNLIPLNTTNNSTATNKVMTTREFNPKGLIYYYNSSTTISANGTVTPTNLYFQLTFDARYSLNCGQTLKTNSPLYLVANKSTTKNSVTLADPAYSQSLPTEDDGKIYIYLGRTYSTYQAELCIHHPIYEFVNGKIRIYQPSLSYNELKDKPTSLKNPNALKFGSNSYDGSEAKTITLSDLGGQTAGNYISYTNNTATVVGNSKTVSKTYPETLFVPNGLIMGGTALSAGLVTRGICGIDVPDESNGSTNKSQLYLNYDGNNTNNPAGRGIVINAGSVGSDLGNGVYSYCAVRGDALKSWVEAKGYTTNTGTVTSVAVKMNGSTKGTITSSGTIDLGTVITAHQDISGKLDKTEAQSTYQPIGDYALNSSIPTVNNPTITIKQGGTTKGSFTLNQSTASTIELDSGGGSITIDSSLSSTSTNPVQNKVIYTALNKKLDGSITNVSSSTTAAFVNNCYLCLPKTTSNVTLTIESTTYTIKGFFLIYATQSIIYLCYYNTSGALTITSKSWTASSSYYFSVKCNYAWCYQILGKSL
jgi:hypothetical protein